MRTLLDKIQHIIIIPIYDTNFGSILAPSLEWIAPKRKKLIYFLTRPD